MKSDQWNYTDASWMFAACTALFTILLTNGLFAPKAFGQAEWKVPSPVPKDWYAPHDLQPDDFMLPGPGGVGFVFRKIYVPGDNFWSDVTRKIQIGVPNSQNHPYSRASTVRVMGSFFAPDQSAPNTGKWWYGFGKYEISIAQYAAVMGDGDLKKGLEYLDSVWSLKSAVDLTRPFKSLPTNVSQRKLNNEKRRRERIVRGPLRGLSQFEYLRFIHKLNRFLLKSLSGKGEAGHATVPHLVCPFGAQQSAESAFPGLVRLPTEIEWEYAARGGHNYIGKNALGETLPFAQDAYSEYSWLAQNANNRVAAIGKRKPVFGLYDTIGNVSEITADHFRPEVGVGKVGGIVVRGGNVRTQLEDAAVGRRDEFRPFEPDPNRPNYFRENRHEFVGLRLAFASYVGPTAECRKAVLASAERSRRVDPDPALSTSSLTQAADLVQTLEKYLRELAEKRANVREELLIVRDRILQLDKLQYEQIRRNNYLQVKSAVFAGAAYARARCKVDQINEAILPTLEIAYPNEAERQVVEKTFHNRLAGFSTTAQDFFETYLLAIEEMMKYSSDHVDIGFQTFSRIDQPDTQVTMFLELTRSTYLAAQAGSFSADRLQNQLRKLYNFRDLGFC